MAPFAQRIHKAQELLHSLKVDALLIQNPTDFLYLTGIPVSRGSLFIRPEQTHVLVDARYEEKCQRESPVPVICTDKREMDDLIAWAWLKNVRLGFDSSTTTVATLHSWELSLNKASELNVQLTPLSEPLLPLRLIKDADEIACMQKAADLCSRGYEYVRGELCEGISEQILARRLEIYWLEQGGEGLSFDPIIAFGPNASIPHYTPGTARLQPGQGVLIDIGVTLNNYHSDMTRVVFYAEPSKEMKRIYEATRAAQAAALELCRPGLVLGELDRKARAVIAEHGFAGRFTHSLGHGIGLDVHESPILRSEGAAAEQVLQPGMAFTIEPGIYVPGTGGVRIEDTVVICEEGHINLTAPSKELLILDPRR